MRESESRCVVCGKAGAVEQRVMSGASIGHAHEGPCFALLWESFFMRETGAASHETEELAWRWRQRRADVEQRPFVVPRPRSPAETELDKLIAANGWSDVARELE